MNAYTYDNPVLEAQPAMVNQADIQNAYVDLYREMRRYIWGYDVVEALANVEISTYRACPDLVEVRSWYNQLKYLVSGARLEDEALDEVMDNFEDIISSADSTFCKLRQVEEVI